MCSADHVDILGASPLNSAILKVAAGRGDLVEDQIESGILDYVEKMDWALEHYAYTMVQIFINEGEKMERRE